MAITLAAQLPGLLSRVDRHVAGTGNHHIFAFDRILLHVFEHLFGKIQKAITGRLFPNQRTAIG